MRNELRLYSRFLLMFGAIFGLLTGCTSQLKDDELAEPQVAEGEEFVVSMGLYSDPEQVTELRAGEEISNDGVESIGSLRILVFDKNQKFLYSTDAVLGNKDDNGASTKTDDAFLPDGKRNDIKAIKEFSATFIKSSETRYLHFIANYDWKGFPQDYFLIGSSAGQLIPELTSKDFKQMWSMVKLDGLDSGQLDGKVVKLLRNYAKISVVSDVSDDEFSLKSFTVCNINDKGTVAPFVPATVDMSDPANPKLGEFEFPFPPTMVTAHPEAKKVTNSSDITDTLEWVSVVAKPTQSFFNLYEVDNSDKSTFVIIQGQKTIAGTPETRYYKIDLVKRTASEPEQFISIVRNNHYRVVIKEIKSDGFKTIDEAIQAPAQNNIFASVELQDFTQVSDGAFILGADPIQMLIVKPGEYTVNTQFSIVDTSKSFSDATKGGAGYMRYYPSWGSADQLLAPLISTDINSRPKSDDDTFTVKVNNIQEDAIKKYYVDVMGLRYFDPDATSAENVTDQQPSYDGYTGATTPISRRVEIIVRKPYELNATIVDDPASTLPRDLLLEFDIDASIPKSVLPLAITFTGADISPRNIGDNRVMTQSIAGKGIVYTYMLREDKLGKRVSIPIAVTGTGDTGTGDTRTKPVEISSIYHAPYTVE